MEIGMLQPRYDPTNVVVVKNVLKLHILKPIKWIHEDASRYAIQPPKQNGVDIVVLIFDEGL